MSDAKDRSTETDSKAILEKNKRYHMRKKEDPMKELYALTSYGHLIDGKVGDIEWYVDQRGTPHSEHAVAMQNTSELSEEERLWASKYINGLFTSDEIAQFGKHLREHLRLDFTARKFRLPIAWKEVWTQMKKNRTDFDSLKTADCSGLPFTVRYRLCTEVQDGVEFVCQVLELASVNAALGKNEAETAVRHLLSQGRYVARCLSVEDLAKEWTNEERCMAVRKEFVEAKLMLRAVENVARRGLRARGEGDSKMEIT